MPLNELRPDGPTDVEMGGASPVRWQARAACLAAALVAGQALVQPTTGQASTPPLLAAPIPRSVWLYEPDPAALPALHSRLDEVLDLVQPVNRLQMADSEIRIHVIPEDWRLTDLPPWEHLRGARLPDPNPNDGYNEARTYDQIRGLGPPSCVDGPLDIAIAEELLVPEPPSDQPGAIGQDVGKILVHEVAHGVECSLTDTQDQSLDRVYRAATGRFPTGMVGDNPTYSASTRREYFAEGVVAWFEAARGPSYRRQWLERNDKALYDLVGQVFAMPTAPTRCDDQRATLVMREGSGPITGTPGADVIIGTPGDDVINGGGGDDVICAGDGDDTVRGGYGADKLFGQGGDDTLDGGAGPDALSGDDGDDTITDTAARNKLLGGPGQDRLDAREPGPAAAAQHATTAAPTPSTTDPGPADTTTATRRNARLASPTVMIRELRTLIWRLAPATSFIANVGSVGASFQQSACKRPAAAPSRH